MVLDAGVPIGEGTLILSPVCNAIAGRQSLCDGKETANINALRIRKEWEGSYFPIDAGNRMLCKES